MDLQVGDTVICIADYSTGPAEPVYFKKGSAYVVSAKMVRGPEKRFCITGEHGYEYWVEEGKIPEEEHFYSTFKINYSRSRTAPEEPKTEKPDPVNHPRHYTQGKVESIDSIESALGPDGFEGFLSGNVMKYLHRYKHKNGVEDLKKARWYLERLIKTKT